MVKWRWVFLTTAILLFGMRYFYFELRAPLYLIPVESNFWIFSVIAFACKYLNHPSKALDYLKPGGLSNLHTAYDFFVLRIYADISFGYRCSASICFGVVVHSSWMLFDV